MHCLIEVLCIALCHDRDVQSVLLRQTDLTRVCGGYTFTLLLYLAIQECFETNQLQTAASYLIILQNLEQLSVARQDATKLFDQALQSHMWELANDIARFLRAIGKPQSSSVRKKSLKPKFSYIETRRLKMLLTSDTGTVVLT